MAYDITVWFNDRAVDPLNKGPITILPGETVSDKTTLTLVGQGAMHYGKHVNENFLHLLENFASDVEPEFPTVGQLWWKKNTIEQTLMVCKEITGTGPKWVPVSTNYWSGPTPPPYNSWLWYDTSNPNTYEHQLKIFNELTGEWDSVARRYVLKTGDELTGNLKFLDNNEGLIGDKGGFTSVITASSPRGPSFISDKHASVTIGAGGSAPSGSEFVVGAFSREPLTSTTQSNRLVTINDSGVMQVHKNVLDMTANKIVNLRNGVIRSDAINFGQLDDVRVNIQTQIDSMGDELDDLAALVDTKVSKFGDTMTGQLTINSQLVTTGLVTFGDSLTVAKNATIGNQLSAVTGTISSNLSVGGTLTVTGDSTLKGKVTAESNVDVMGQLAVTGATTLRSLSTLEVAAAQITNNKHVANKEYVDGAIVKALETFNTKVDKKGDTMTGDLKITGAKLSVTGDVTFSSKLSVSGDTTTGHLKSQSGWFMGALRTESTLGVIGSTALTGSLTVDGLSSFNKVITMNIPRNHIINSKHLVTKEYVDAVIGGIGPAPAPTLDYDEIARRITILDTSQVEGEGYIVIGNWMMQWGVTAATEERNMVFNHNFKRPFSKCVHVLVGTMVGGEKAYRRVANKFCGLISFSNTGFQWCVDAVYGSKQPPMMGSYIAIGLV